MGVFKEIQKLSFFEKHPKIKMTMIMKPTTKMMTITKMKTASNYFCLYSVSIGDALTTVVVEPFFSWPSEVRISFDWVSDVLGCIRRSINCAKMQVIIT